MKTFAVFLIFYLAHLNFTNGFKIDKVDIENLYRTLQEHEIKQSNKSVIQDFIINTWNGTCQISCPNNRKKKFKILDFQNLRVLFYYI